MTVKVVKRNEARKAQAAVVSALGALSLLLDLKALKVKIEKGKAKPAEKRRYSNLKRRAWRVAQAAYARVSKLA